MASLVVLGAAGSSALLLARSAAAQAAPGVAPLPAADAPALPWHREAEAAAKAAQAARLHQAKPADGAAALPLDVTYYALELSFDTVARTVQGAVVVEARIGTAPLASIHLDFDTVMHVDSLRVDGQTVSYAHTADDLVVQLPRTYVAGEPVRLDVAYAGSPTSASALHFDTRNTQPVIWTLSEPYGARTWWPCQDTPADKADSVDVALEVPAALVAISNGTLRRTTTTGTRTTYHWHESYPITPYLVSVAAHPYVELAATYTPQAGGAMPVRLHAYSDQVGLAQPILALTVQVLDRFAQLFGEYPFVTEKYVIAQFPWGGGMEHQTATSQCCWSTALTVHETAHQWYGDAVTCEDFGHVWLNEGFATYAEALWDEGQGGTAAYLANIWANRFYGGRTIYVPPAEATSFSRIFDGSLSYNKASWVLHMLRGVIGDGAFFTCLQNYLADPRFAYGTATTEGFQSVAEAASGRNLQNFFERWIYTPYFPTYLYDWSATAAAPYQVDLSLEQIQGHALYHMPVRVRVTTTAGSEDFIVQDSLALQSFQLPLAAEPVAVTIDPEHWILCTTEPQLRSPNFYRGLLVVNGVSWTVGSELTSAYADSVFSAGYPFSFWDSDAAPSGGYVAQLPAPLGHGALPPEVLQQFSSVVWVGDTDLDLWNNAALVSYLRAGGNLLFLGRRGQEYLHPSRSGWLGLRWAESPSVTLASAAAADPRFVPMSRTNTQSGCAVFETSFDQPETVLLLTEPASFAVPRGIAAWRRPISGGAVRPAGGNFVVVSGRPYRWSHTALRTNVRTALEQLFGEPTTPTSSLVPAGVTRLLDPAPNPFNPSVVLRWELAQAGVVRLDVYDARGRRVRQLADEPRPAGPGMVLWDGRDAARRPVASGLYFLRFAAADVTRTVKLTVTR